MEKHPLTHQSWPFAVRHRLQQDLLTSPHGPFVVELFAVGVFPIAGPVRHGFDCRQPKAPHVSQVERGQRPQNPLDGITRS